jgi:hypothetical protein
LSFTGQQYLVINKLQKRFTRGAELDFKRALVRPQKGIF